MLGCLGTGRTARSIAYYNNNCDICDDSDHKTKRKTTEALTTASPTTTTQATAHDRNTDRKLHTHDRERDRTGDDMNTEPLYSFHQ